MKKNSYLRMNEILYVKHRAEPERLDTKVLIEVLSVDSKLIRFFSYSHFPNFLQQLLVLESLNKLYLKNRYCWLNSTFDGGRVSFCSR